MAIIIFDFIVVLIGLILTGILFYRFPVLPRIKSDSRNYPSVSIIIPARNEEKNLPLLLEDLKNQTHPVHEIICADDASDDDTAKIAQSFGAKLISLHDKPQEWTGKSWACQNGADAATGEVLLFLDADVRLGNDGVQRIIQEYMRSGCAVSVQPYHKTEENYEQFSMMFNLVQIAANGTSLPKPLNLGLYGPVILISRSDYVSIGGHEGVKTSVIEDMALGSNLRKAGLPYHLFVGDQDIAFRMYSGGFRSLVQGWVKNLAAGASRMPLYLFMMVFVWIASLTSVPMQIVKFSVGGNIPWLIVYLPLYVLWVILLFMLTKRVGRFHLWALLLYPLPILLFLCISAVSMFKKIFGLKVTWKGRAIDTGKKQCE